MPEYIEREALIKGIADIINTAPMTYAGGLVLALNSVRSAPAADVQPVRHGRYITDDMGDSSCSECGERYLDVTQKYCPNCGAKMDKEEE